MSNRIGIDTNVLLRISVQDDRNQADTVDRLLAGLKEEQYLFVGRSVILETSWVLQRSYRYPRDTVLDFIQAILERREFEVEDYEAVGNAVNLCRTASVDFADSLLSETNRLQGCSHTLTFDKQAAAKIPGMELLA